MALLGSVGRLFGHIASPLGHIVNDIVPMRSVGHVLGDIGQTAGDILAPKLMASIPGTALNHAYLQHIAEQEQMKQDALNAREGLENAEAWKDTHPVVKPDKPLPPQEQAFNYDLQHGQNPAQAEASIYHPVRQEPVKDTAAWFMPPNGKPGSEVPGFTENAANFLGTPAQREALPAGYTPFERASAQREDAFHEWLAANPGKNYNDYLAALQASKRAGDVGPALEQALNFRSILQHGYSDNPALLKILPQFAEKMGITLSPEDQAVLSTPPPGWQYDPVTGKPIGTHSPQFASGQTKQRMQFSQEVLPTLKDTMQQIRSNPNLVGVISGRANDIWTGKIGSPNAPYYSLLTNLHNIATAWSKIHTDTDKARQEFTDLLSSAQSPANLLAALGAIGDQMNIYANYHSVPQAASGASTAPKPPSNTHDPLGIF